MGICVVVYFYVFYYVCLGARKTEEKEKENLRCKCSDWIDVGFEGGDLRFRFEQQYERFSNSFLVN